MWHQSVHTIVSSLPPVIGGSLEQKQRRSLLERELPTSPAGVVETSDGFERVGLWNSQGAWDSEDGGQTQEVTEKQGWGQQQMGEEREKEKGSQISA